MAFLIDELCKAPNLKKTVLLFIGNDETANLAYNKLSGKYKLTKISYNAFFVEFNYTQDLTKMYPFLFADERDFSGNFYWINLSSHAGKAFSLNPSKLKEKDFRCAENFFLMTFCVTTDNNSKLIKRIFQELFDVKVKIIARKYNYLLLTEEELSRLLNLLKLESSYSIERIGCRTSKGSPEVNVYAQYDCKNLALNISELFAIIERLEVRYNK